MGDFTHHDWQNTYTREPSIRRWRRGDAAAGAVTTLCFVCVYACGDILITSARRSRTLCDLPRKSNTKFMGAGRGHNSICFCIMLVVLECCADGNRRGWHDRGGVVSLLFWCFGCDVGLSRKGWAQFYVFLFVCVFVCGFAEIITYAIYLCEYLYVCAVWMYVVIRV